MIALFKARFRGNTNIPIKSQHHEPPQSSTSTAVAPDLGRVHVEDWTRLPPKFRLKKIPYFKKSETCPSNQGSSSCSTPSSATAADGSPVMARLDSLEATKSQQRKLASVATAAPSIEHILDLDSYNLIPSHFTSFDPSCRNSVDTGLMLENITIPTLPSTGTSTSHATRSSTPLSPSGSSSLIPSSSSSTTSTEHSSYSATQNLDHNTTNVDELPSRSTKRRRQPGATKCETRTVALSLRPLGPVHLEYDYMIARKELSTAVATAAYDLFGFSVPVRSDAIEAKRPGKESIALLRGHQMVRKAAEAVDRADSVLEAALARGETLQNTPIPEEWRWGSEYLREEEWAVREPDFVPEKRVTRSKTRPEFHAESSEPRERAQKRKDRKNDAPGKKGRGQSGRIEDNSETRTTSSRASRGEATASRRGSSIRGPSSGQTTTDSSTTPPREKRKRRRPSKNVPETFNAQDNEEKAALTKAEPVPAPFSSAIESGSPSRELPVKRKRGRPRKYPLDPVPPSLAPSKSDAATEVEAERRSKRRRVGSSHTASSR